MTDTFCFAAGTLVHTKHGAAPIETIQAGDWVLSQPEDTGARDYKRVLRTFKFEQKAVFRLRYCGTTPETCNDVHSLIVTANHTFFVSGYDPSCVDPEQLDPVQHQVGWRRADLLEYGAMLVLANGESYRVMDSDPIWRSNTEGIGWIAANRDAELGWFVDMRDGKNVIEIGDHDYIDLTEEGDFANRYELGTEEHWAFKCDVFNFEVEDFHTYYVGQLGVWVHNSNCSFDGTFTATGSLPGGRDPTGCFIAGTLVHTRGGLVPIEQVRVGDWVLSQPENKDGSAPAYRLVVNTFAFDDKEIVLVRCYQEDGTVEQFGVTPNHPFWVKNVGWTRADQLGGGTELELRDCSEATTLCASPLFRTGQPGQGWASGVWGVEANDGSGALIDLRGQPVVVGADGVFNWDVLDDEHADPRVRSSVYNLEVDEFHTYYVGEMGVWVHNSNCGGVGVALSHPTGCFVAGTLVHSKDGPVPIEQVQVGDLVLSQPGATGPRSYKRVVNTFRFENKEVYVVKWYTATALAAARKASTTVPLEEIHAMVVTGNHSFRVKGLGWTRADHLENHHELELADGRPALVSTIDKVYRTTIDNVGWVRGRGIDDDYGRLLDLRGGQIVLAQERVPNDGIDWWEGDRWLQPAVYSLEVEDNHTYYVDTLGVWVCDSDCGNDSK
jgi:hypothetical protein